MDSNLKTQFPLSPRKFWKKIIEKLVVFLVLFTIGSFMIFILGVAIGISIIATSTVAIFVFASIMALYALYVHYYIKTYYYSDDGDFLTIKKGVFAPTEIHVQYLKIQDVYVDQDIIDRIMGLYDVHISSATYTSGIEAHIDGVEKKEAESLKNLLLNKIKGSSSSHHSTVASDATRHEEAQHSQHKVHFSSPISSDVYGLTGNWWTGEIIKIFIGSIITSFFISFWIYSEISDGYDFFSSDFAMMALIWGALFVFFLAFRSGYLFLWKSHYKYEFGEEYVYMKEGVLSISEKNMGYNTIQDVQVRQSFIDRIFGVADLVIENASPGSFIDSRGQQRSTGSNGIVIEGLSLLDARKIADEMKKVILSKRTSTKGL